MTQKTETTNDRMNCTILGSTIEFSFPGEIAPIRIDATSLTSTIRDHAALHGLKQKIADAAAIPRDTVTGRSATWSQKRAAMAEVVQRLNDGEWNKNRESDGTTTGGLLFEALCRHYPAKSPDDIRAFLAGKDKSQQAALRANPKIAAIIAAIKSERTEIDSDDLLSELE